MVEDALSFWTEIQRYEDMLAADAKSLCFAPLSELYRKLGLLDDAIMVAQKGCAAHPEYHVGFFMLGAACYAKGLVAEARQALEKVISLRPDHLETLKLLGQVYVEQNDIVAARKVLGRVLEQEPDDMESTLLLNSIASVTPQEPEEEILEELEIIEDLEELTDEALVVEEPLDMTGFGRQSAAAVSAREPRREAESPPRDSEEFWAIEDLGGDGAEAREAQAWSERPAVPDPLTTATLAELYASQGFTQKAIGIYRELLEVHPSNQQYRLRCAELQELHELQTGAAQPVEAQPVAEGAGGPPVRQAPAAAWESSILEEPILVEEPFEMEELLVEDEALLQEEPPVAPEPAVMEFPAAQEPLPAAKPAAMEVPAAIDVPVAMEIPASSESPFAMQMPVAMEPPAVMEEPALDVAGISRQAAGEPAGDAEAELQRWLENIRRRRDGA